MKICAAIKLKTTPEQEASLKATLERCNLACSWLARTAFEEKQVRQFDLHKLAYKECRERFDLAAQATVRCIAKVADAFKVNRKVCPRFRRFAAQPYDDRLMSFKPDDIVSLWTVDGRIKLSWVAGERQRALMEFRKGEADLAYIRRKWFLICTCDVPETEEFDPEDWIGVDLGIVNIATDSDGTSHSGAKVELLRRIHSHRRRNLQKKGTRAARRKINRLKGKQARFQKITNHTISKAIVTKAQGTCRGIALEDLQGIRGRTRVRRRQRARMANWAFHQLRSFVTYKAALVGVPVLLIDPRNSSRECAACGWVDKANRRSQSEFHCRSCGNRSHADDNAAEVLRSRARAACRPAIVDNDLRHVA